VTNSKLEDGGRIRRLSLFGGGDPQLMAGGISRALMTTAMGLTTAIPLLILHSLAKMRSEGLIEILEEQAAGLVARHAEAGNRRADDLAA